MLKLKSRLGKRLQMSLPIFIKYALQFKILTIFSAFIFRERKTSSIDLRF